MVNVVLDLDLTLIRAITVREFNTLAAAGQTPPLKSYKFADYVIFERPGLDEFLKAAATLGTISVWTAASKSYGEFIVENIINPRLAEKDKVKLFLSAEACEGSEQVYGVLKHLDMLYAMARYGYSPAYNRSNTVLVDDNRGVLAQNSYVILAREFNLNPNDTELQRVLRKIRVMNK